LRYNDFSLEGLAATAQGPPRAINTELAATRFTAAQFIAEDMGLTARVNLREGVQASLSALSGVAADTTFSLREPASVTLDDGVAVERLRLNWGRGGEIALDGAFDSARWRASLGLVDADVPGADSRVTAHLDLDTDRDTPARGVFQLRSLLTQTQEARLSGDFIWNGETIILSSAQDGDALDMRVILPAKLVRAPAIRVETDGAFDGYMRYDGDIALIAAYLPPELQTLEGAFAADFEFSGTLDAPVIAGHARIDDGAYTELQTGFSLTGLHARADASYGDGQSVIRFLGGAQGSAPAEQDSITLTGEMMLGDTSNLALSVALNRVALSADPIAHLVASGRVDLAGPLDSLAAKGKITIEELNVEIVTPENTGLVPIEVAGYDSRGLAPSSGQLRPDSTLDYDIALLARDRIFIRGRGLESEWSADVAIVNENDGPMIVGEMRLRRGALDFSGRRFDLTRGAISFDRLSPNNPRLDIRAEYNAGDGVTAIIAFSGRTEAPQVALSSTPSLPSEDVMALVLFGKPANELTAIESLQAAQALAALGGVGLFGSGGDIASTLRQAVGLDLLNVDIDPENGGGSLTVGKYVADGVFVSATQDAKGESGSVHVEYEITNNISVETEIEQTGDQTVSANWKRDF
jgi:translocation and assembly module TamB